MYLYMRIPYGKYYLGNKEKLLQNPPKIFVLQFIYIWSQFELKQLLALTSPNSLEILGLAQQ